jgi:hypothetical protein
MADITIESLQKELEATRQENEQLAGVNTQLTKQVEDLSKNTTTASTTTASTTTTGSISSQTFTVNGVTYGFALPAVMHLVGGSLQKITAVEVLASKDLQAEMVSLGSGFIVKK